MKIETPILMSQAEIDFLHSFVGEHVPEEGLILELGSWKGGSTIVMASNQRKVLSIDYWGDETFIDWTNNVTKAGVMKYVTPLRGDDLAILSALLPVHGGLFDFVLLDTSHTYIQTKREVELVYPLVKLNGWMFFHDVTHPDYPGVKMVWDELAVSTLRNVKMVDTLWGGQK